MEAATMHGAAAAMKTTAAAAMAPAPALSERRTGGSNGQGRQGANDQPTYFPACHDSSPSFL
jgi:hypothetical protein